MYCDVCGRYGSHASRCPYNKTPTSHYYCSVCDEGIYDGDEYIVNENGEYAHWECVDYGRDLAKFLGYEIKTMEEE